MNIFVYLKLYILKFMPTLHLCFPHGYHTATLVSMCNSGGISIQEATRLAGSVSTVAGNFYYSQHPHDA
jgi:hypothetical protein